MNNKQAFQKGLEIGTKINDYKKINKTRRSRGYNFEYSMVNAFNNTDGWCARRLGGSSTGLPDLVITNNNKSILYALEAKSGESNILYIPQDQIFRCRDIVDNFLSIYKERWIVFAFKFKGTTKRKLQYRILPTDLSHCHDFKDMKGVSYNLSKEQLTFHYNTYLDDVCFNEVGLKSISEFVNFL